MNSVKILKTQIEDLDIACELYHDAIAFQKRNGFPEYRWDDREVQREYIEQGKHYKVLIEDEIAGIFNLQHSDKMTWRELDTGESIYLHGVLVHTKFKGNGIFGKILEWVKEISKRENKQSIRLDSWDNNDRLLNYYKSFGFEVIEHYQTPDTPDIPLNCRGNKVVLMEYPLRKKYMVIERFYPGKIKELYTRFDSEGRLLPEGVVYMDSWIDENLEICYQLMESESIELLDQWTANWKDLANFEIVPVINSKKARQQVLFR